ncbi:unnamed protein product [Dibothriocephalus latus]|uniref:Uncharacterized protein n=1 Tax=Dibothriocephalus latus TaxID=60516 RepID=A0A3P6T4B1_DIBLA|nr:unnamed protein product [Dibothriocephalus latus]
MTVPYRDLQPAKLLAGFENPGSNLMVNTDVAVQRASEIGDIHHSVGLDAIDNDPESTIDKLGRMLCMIID